eukprot:TRINITY_DN3793_c0_g2_i4.p2 TRINITY_DN3793_c0_g2~~TRINITY_DN3793_c0_g2_i4.p2  ORF type:complete len:304 (+),score=75.30 TRINITY_DN3793_c0_g2_i4:138-914(+)
MLLGVALGDALGAPTETMLPKDRAKRFGEVQGYLKRVGTVTDDTQLTFWTIQQMLEDRGFVPFNVADKIATPATGGGSTCADFTRKFRALTAEDIKQGAWMRCGVDRSSNGALMRIVPVLLPYLHQYTSPSHPPSQLAPLAPPSTSSPPAPPPSLPQPAPPPPTQLSQPAPSPTTSPQVPDTSPVSPPQAPTLWVDAVVLSSVSHFNSASIASCVGFTYLLWHTLSMMSPPKPEWHTHTAKQPRSAVPVEIVTIWFTK